MINVAPESATACEGEIIGFCGCTLVVHTSPLGATFNVTIVSLSSLLTTFLVGYKVGSEEKKWF
jgi:hypothetical protein